MGKRRKRLRMLKYAKKYALKRSTAAKIEDRAEDLSLASPEPETTVPIVETAKPSLEPDLQPVFEAPPRSIPEDEPKPRAVLKKTQSRSAPTKKKATKTKRATTTRKKK